MRYAFNFVILFFFPFFFFNPITSGSRQSLYHLVGRRFRSVLQRVFTLVIVLAIIQEKVNNPSPDDPFEPDIAAVSLYVSRILILVR